MNDALSFDRRGEVAVLTLDNERKLNSLSPAILAALAGALDRLERDGTLRAVVVTGAGERAFCAGADIKAWGDLDPFEFARRWVVDGHRLFDRLSALHVPVIAALNGSAFGGGLELAAACDLRIAVKGVELGLPEAAIGVVPGWSGIHRLGRVLAPGVVRELALTGRRLGAERAFQLGFLNELVEDDAVGAALTMAEEICGLAPRSVEVAKHMLAASDGVGRDSAIDALAGGLVATTADKAEGVASFREKRPPRFSGR